MPVTVVAELETGRSAPEVCISSGNRGARLRGVLLKGAFWAPSGNCLLRTPSENPSQNPFLL